MGGRLDGKVALITGAGAGIGEAAALRFAAEGAKIAAADLEPEIADAIVKRVTAAGGEAFSLSGDVSKRAEVDEFVASAVAHFGRIDILVNSAGVSSRQAPSEFDFEQVWEWTINVNLKGSYLVARAVTEHMKVRRRGSVIHLASIMGMVGYAQGMSDGFHPYSHSKGGIMQLTRDMAVALAKDGIRVNALCPGFTYTQLTQVLTDDPEMLAKLESLHPIGRLGRPEEIANAALFLASDEASFITGVCLPVDGGYTAQ